MNQLCQTRCPPPLKQSFDPQRHLSWLLGKEATMQHNLRSWACWRWRNHLAHTRHTMQIHANWYLYGHRHAREVCMLIVSFKILQLRNDPAKIVTSRTLSFAHCGWFMIDYCWLITKSAETAGVAAGVWIARSWCCQPMLWTTMEPLSALSTCP